MLQQCFQRSQYHWWSHTLRAVHESQKKLLLQEGTAGSRSQPCQSSVSRKLQHVVAVENAQPEGVLVKQIFAFVNLIVTVKTRCVQIAEMYIKSRFPVTVF